jgi:hypothetical protein
MKITIEVSKAQYLGLRAVAVSCGIPSTDILEQFVADLAGGHGSGGSDERRMADDYLKRCNYAFALHYDPQFTPPDPQIEKQLEQAGKWYSACFIADKAEREEWQRDRLKTRQNGL